MIHVDLATVWMIVGLVNFANVEQHPSLGVFYNEEKEKEKQLGNILFYVWPFRRKERINIMGFQLVFYWPMTHVEFANDVVH